jgi:heat shock protein HtpX
MRRIDGDWASQKRRLSVFEVATLQTGLLAVAVGAVTALFVSDATGGVPRVLGLAGLAALLLCAASRGGRLYRAGIKASLPAAVGRTPVRIRPARGFIACAVVVAVVLPLAAAVALLVIVDWAWLLVAGVLVIGGAVTFVTATGDDNAYHFYGSSAQRAEALLLRLCIRADMPVPPLVVEYDADANAWTAGGRIHVTDTLLELLDERELEAVLAHELAHLARRDAAVMEICSAPSRVLVGYAALVGRGTLRGAASVERPSLRGVLSILELPLPWGIALLLAFFALLCVPPAFVVGWISRLSVLGISRAREHSADAAAVTLTGSPSALASALMKLDCQRQWTPRHDLRQAYSMLCIVASARSRLGRLLSTHPPVAARVERLEALERRIQARPRR